MRILVDSSVWIEFLRNGNGASPELAHAIRTGQAMICPVVWVEIWSGIRGKREQSVFDQVTDLCPTLPMDEKTWELAGELGRAAKRAGLNCPVADVLIVACAKRHGAGLLHQDKHMTALLEL
jgi:predicted nucleic acid-binding protein